jgi:TolB protein
MSVDGTDLRKLPPCEEQTLAEKWYEEECRDPSWSPDGKKIAFVKRAGHYNYPTLRWNVYVANVDGVGVRRLTEPEDEGHASKPVWSPDGSKIAFLRSVDEPYIFENNRDIYVINADGSGERRLAQCNYCLTLAWSPDGTKISFGSSNRNGEWGIYIMNTDGSNAINLTERWTSQRPQWLPQQALVDGLTWSPDGKCIAFTLGVHHYVSIGATISSWQDHPGHRVIWVISADGMKLYSVTYSHHPDWSKELWDYDPAWSPVLP